MARVHFLTVGEGDCTIIEHNSGRVSVIDICNGNQSLTKSEARLLEALEKPRGNFAMCKCKTNPIEYLQSLGVNTIFRFILSHPDMDHLDGFDALSNSFKILNIWDSGARKEKPDFNDTNYREEDWDKYVKYRDGKIEGVTVVNAKAGARFRYANKKEEENDTIDALYIAAPNKEIIDNANETQEFNDASYIISYWSNGGKIIIPGDAHDASWECAIENYKGDIFSCSFLLAPHHGRKSGRSYEFLKVTQPEVSLLGCAPSENLAYNAWNNRNLPYFTQNQAGNVVLEISKNTIEIYIQNESFAEKAGGNTSITNSQGYFLLGTLKKDSG